MPRLRSRMEMPPSGWQFSQTETGRVFQPWIGFNEQVQEIIKHRLDNPRFKLATDRAAVESELEDFTVRRIMDMGPSAAGFLLDAPAMSPPSFPVPRPKPQSAGVAGGAKKAVAGAALLIEWLGEGLKPVGQAQANQRAAICVDCPQNRDPNLAQSAMGAVARGFHLLMEAKADMHLKTPADSKLKTCQACDCDLRLKVHAEIAHIKKHTSKEVMGALDPRCWILSEAKAA